MNNLKPSPLETLINDALQQLFLHPDQLDINYIVFEISNEKKRIAEAVFQLGNAKNAEYHIQACQCQLIRLIDHMIVAQHDADIEQENLYKSIYRSLEDVLRFLEKEYACYLNLDCKIPMLYLFSIQEHFQQEIQTISQADIDPPLKALIMKPFNDFIAAEGSDFLYSYQETVYLEKLLRQLNKLIADPSFSDDTAWKILYLLLELDFNDPDYLKYVMDMITKEIEELPFISAKMERIFLLQKNFNQVLTNRGIYLKKLHEPLKQQLQLWLAEELNYLEKRKGQSDTRHIPADLLQWKDYKVQTKLSVPQLGRFFGLLMELDIIQIDKNKKKELAEFVAFFFTSIQSDAIAPDNLRNSFYDKSPALKKALMNILSDMMNLLKK